MEFELTSGVLALASTIKLSATACQSILDMFAKVTVVK